MVGGGIGRDIEDVPNVFGKRERTPLQRKTQPRRIRRQPDHDIAQSLSLGVWSAKALTVARWNVSECTFADQINNPTSRPAQFWISCVNNIGFPSSYQSEQKQSTHPRGLVDWITICRPLMPQTKSNHGSIARCGLVFFRTWKPKPLPGPGGRSSAIGRNLLSHDMGDFGGVSGGGGGCEGAAEWDGTAVVEAGCAWHQLEL